MFFQNRHSFSALVDHRNWDKTDNRKQNLRIASKSQNNMNIKRKSNNTSGYTGVSVNKQGKYIAAISIGGKKHHLGTYEVLEDAVRARHEAEQKLHADWSGEHNRQDYQRIMGETK